MLIFILGLIVMLVLFIIGIWIMTNSGDLLTHISGAMMVLLAVAGIMILLLRWPVPVP